MEATIHTRFVVYSQTVMWHGWVCVQALAFDVIPVKMEKSFVRKFKSAAAALIAELQGPEFLMAQSKAAGIVSMLMAEQQSMVTKIGQQLYEATREKVLLVTFGEAAAYWARSKLAADPFVSLAHAIHPDSMFSNLHLALTESADLPAVVQAMEAGVVYSATPGLRT